MQNDQKNLGNLSLPCFSEDVFDAVEQKRATLADATELVRIREVCESVAIQWRWAKCLRCPFEPFALQKLGASPGRLWISNACGEAARHFRHGFDDSETLRVVIRTPVIHRGRKREDVTLYWQDGDDSFSAAWRDATNEFPDVGGCRLTRFQQALLKNGRVVSLTTTDENWRQHEAFTFHDNQLFASSCLCQQRDATVGGEFGLVQGPGYIGDYRYEYTGDELSRIIRTCRDAVTNEPVGQRQVAWQKRSRSSR
ncbi:MAG: hypothetical protein KDA85_05200 [Planctomycetaceae bacterium]|nr:hypothetical protein [Planctomycetaceae bacterium]